RRVTALKPTRASTITRLPYTPLFRSVNSGCGVGDFDEHAIAIRTAANTDHPIRSIITGVRNDGRQGVSQLRRVDGNRRQTGRQRSEEHTSELQSRENLVCRLQLAKTT